MELRRNEAHILALLAFFEIAQCLRRYAPEGQAPRNQRDHCLHFSKIVSWPKFDAKRCCRSVALWCWLGCCSRTVAVYKLRRTNALTPVERAKKRIPQRPRESKSLPFFACNFGPGMHGHSGPSSNSPRPGVVPGVLGIDQAARYNQLSRSISKPFQCSNGRNSPPRRHLTAGSLGSNFFIR